MRLLPEDPELGWTPYAWLIYLVSFVASPAATRASALEWTLTGAGLSLFLALYFRGFWYRDRRILWCAGGILLLGVLFSPVNFGGGVFFIYAAAFFAYLRPPRLAWLLIGGVVAVLGLEVWLADLEPWVWLPAAVLSPIIGGINIHHFEVSEANARLRLAQEEVERLAKTAERERIARDLHDLLGHTLSLITLKSELAGKLIERDPERAKHEIAEVERVSREALREVRSAIAGYRSEGLQAELARARLALESAGVKLEYFTAPVELEPVRETALALALREAVTNVIRHAGARVCRIALAPTEGEVRLEVRDDGRGGTAAEGTGLAAMRERIAGLGGTLERHGAEGTSLVITLPRRRAEAQHAAPLRVAEEPA
jgi:two-component system sensor histidine kinase DesK